MARQDPPPGPRPLPATQRLIVRYAKRGRLRFASHRDIARAVERGVRKAGLPIALSAGFTPHPKISYAGAAPTGTASEAEYLELSLTEHRDASNVRIQLDAALPDGIDVIDVLDGPVPLAGLHLEASEWEVVLPGVRPAEAARAATEFLALPAAEVERLTNKGMRRVDARAAVITMAAGPRPAAPQGNTADKQSDGNAILRMVVRHVIPAVRPDDILAALRRDTSLAPASPPKVTRLAQGPIGEVTARAGAVDLGRRERPPGGMDRMAGEEPIVELSATTTTQRDDLRRTRSRPEIDGSRPLLSAEADRRPGATRPGAAAQPSGQGAAQEQVETTRPGAAGTTVADVLRASAYDQFPRGAEEPGRAFAPGSLTGDCPDARARAEQRVQQ